MASININYPEGVFLLAGIVLMIVSNHVIPRLNLLEHPFPLIIEVIGFIFLIIGLLLLLIE